MWMGSGSLLSTIARSASSMRSSSSPVTFGAPAVRISFPPSVSTSEARNETSCASAARSTIVNSCWSALAATSFPWVSISASMPPYRMNATVTGRCSGSAFASRRCSRTALGRQLRDGFGRHLRPRAQRHLRELAGRLAQQQAARLLRLAEALRGERGARLGTDDDLVARPRRAASRPAGSTRGRSPAARDASRRRRRSGRSRNAGPAPSAA